MYLDNQNFTEIERNLSGSYHLTEHIDFNHQVILPIGAPDQFFDGTLNGHNFTINNYQQENTTGLFHGLGDHAVLMWFGLNNITLSGESAYPLAATAGDDCVININFVKNLVVNASQASALIGTFGNNNEVSLGYAANNVEGGLNASVCAATLALKAGNGNSFSLGYGAIPFFSEGKVAGIVANAGTNNTIYNSLMASALVPGSDAKSLVGNNETECLNTLWLTGQGFSEPGCSSLGLSDEELKNLTPESSGLTGFDVTQFRFGDYLQYPLARPVGEALAKRDDALCHKLACQPRLCDLVQSVVVAQLFDENYQYRYVLSRESRGIADEPLYFRVVKVGLNGRLDRSFGDEGIARYYPEDSFPVNLSISNAAMISNAGFSIVAKDKSNKVKILTFPLADAGAENRYSVESARFKDYTNFFSPSSATPAGEPLLMFTYNGRLPGLLAFFVTSPVIVIIFHSKSGGLNHYQGYGKGAGKSEYITSDILRLKNSEKDALAAVVDPGLEHAFFYFLTLEAQKWLLSRVNVFDLGEIKEFESDNVLDSPAQVGLYIRSAGVWLIQTSETGNYTVDLFNVNAKLKNETIAYTFDGSGIGEGFVIPDDAERPLLHLAFFNSSEGCLNVNERVRTDVVLSYGCQLPFFCELISYLNQLKIYLRAYVLWLSFLKGDPQLPVD